MKHQTALSRREPLFTPAPMSTCQIGGCPIEPTTRFTVKRKGAIAPSLDVCDMHLRKLASEAKEGSFHVCPLSSIEESRKKELEKAEKM